MSSPAIQGSELPVTVAMLPMDNNTRFAFNKDVFANRLKAELNQKSNGALRFIARDVMQDIQSEREAKRAGEIDYDPARRTATVAGADFFLRGQVDGLSTASTMGQAEYSLYTFKLIDTETGIELWEDYYELKKEGRDDVIYR
jgi:PBP1b-binding outer membrane lipoprotein LpoB